MDDRLQVCLLLFNVYNLNIMWLLSPVGAFILVVAEMVTFSSYCCWTNETTKVTLLPPLLSRGKNKATRETEAYKKCKKKKKESRMC